MSTQPLVTVITTTYNRPSYLKIAIESALAQTFQDFEVIVSDDNGSLENEGVVASFGDPRLRYRRNASNVGLCLNTLYAIQAAKGKYIARLDDDDQWEATLLSKLVPPLEADPKLVVAFGDYFIIDESGNINFEQTEACTRTCARDQLKVGIQADFPTQALVHMDLIHISLVAVLRKDAINWSDYPRAVGIVNDTWMNYLACCSGKGAYYCPERLARYRVHPGSISVTQRVEMHKGLIYLYSRILSDAKFPHLHKLFSQRYAFFHINCGIDLLRKGKLDEGRAYLINGCRLQPNLRGLVALLLSPLPPPVLQAVSLRSFGWLNKLSLRL